MNISLLPEEANLFEQLLSVAIQNSVTLRIAGGWVRDKLMDRNSKDIDVVVENSTGIEFARTLQNHKNFELIKVSENPEQSVHLHGATLSILGFPIDFMSLRKEMYDPGSRIPKIEAATPQEDCLRRDFTINALYYNLHTQQVEDFTNFGILDLENRILRPLCGAKISFDQDPLRIIRALRFRAALSSENVVKRLEIVARSRMAVDFLQIFDYNIEDGLAILCEFPLVFDFVFAEILRKLLKSPVNVELWIAYVKSQTEKYFKTQDFERALASASEILQDFAPKNYSLDDKSLKRALGFALMGRFFDSREQQNFDVSSLNLSKGKKNAVHRFTILYAVPFFCLSLSTKFCTLVQELIGVIDGVENVITQVSTQKAVLMLQSCSFECLIAALALLPEQVTKLFSFYTEQFRILKTKPNVINLQHLLFQCRVDRSQTAQFKEQCQLFMLNFPSYPNLEEKWQQYFIQQYLDNQQV